MNYDNLLINIFFKNDKINRSTYLKLIKRSYNNICLYLTQRYDEFNSIRETLYRIKYNIDNVPICPVCGTKLKFNGRNGILYLSHCSNRCKKLDENVNNKWKESCGELGTNRNKAKETMIKRYGVANPYQIDKVINKVKIINKQKYKKSLEKRNNTCLRKYGVESYLQTNDCKEKRKQTSLVKYGTEHPMQSNVVKSKYDWDKIISKIISTKEKNHTFNTSKEEDESYKLLKTLYNDIKRQYKEKRYPFLCDFYIPSLDLFIECQYGWQHGKHPFDVNNIDDCFYINKIKDKHTKYYDNVIYNWTVRDPLKRKIAKDNNLNYVEFWSVNELKEWIKTQMLKQ